MAVGFQSINDGGTVQLDTNYKNYVLTSSGTLTLDISTGGRVDGMPAATLVVTGATAPIIAFNRLRLCLYRVTQSGSTWTYTFIGFTFPDLPNPATFNYYVFDVGYSAVPGTNCGLLLYDAAGALAFDSNNIGFPSVVGTASRLGNAAETTTTFAAGRTIAIVQAQAGFHLTGSAPFTSNWITLAEATANAVTLHPRNIGGSYLPYSAYYTSVPSKYLFLDITDLL